MRIRAAAGLTLRILRRLCGVASESETVQPVANSPEITPQDVNVLMDAMRLWQSDVDLATVAAQVIGCGCSVCNPEPGGYAAKFTDRETEIKQKFMGELASRRERSIRICAKLISLRDSIVAENFMRESIHAASNH
jgi:hypothetical protein